MEKIKITGDYLNGLKFQLANLITNLSFSDPLLSYNHEVEDIIYHYTDLNALINIVEKQKLWATNINFLNDRNEFNHGVNLILEVLRKKSDKSFAGISRQIIKDIKRIYTKDRFVVCFSNKGDLLSQWRGYTIHGKGISIGFRRTWLKSSLIQNIKEKYIVYDENTQVSVIKKLLEIQMKYFTERKELFDWAPYNFESLAASSIIEFLEYVVSDYKHPSFSEESEYRIELEMNDELKTKRYETIKYRSNGNLIIPYVELETKSNYYNNLPPEENIGSPTILVDKLPIEKIIVGPSLDFNSVEMGINQLLKTNGYEEVEIKPSRIPYRV